MGLRERLVKKFDDEIVFIKGMIDQPDKVGAIVPTSRRMARRMAGQIDLSSNLPVLELGPGTGVITREILDFGVKPQNLYAVEYSEQFSERLQDAMPDVNIINGDAFDLDMALGVDKDMVFDCVIASMPLLNFPMEQRIRLIDDLLDRIPHGRPIILFSYGATAPVASQLKGNGPKFRVTPVEWIIRNVPPARIWAYSRV